MLYESYIFHVLERADGDIKTVAIVCVSSPEQIPGLGFCV
jgi:hypothetical protein